MNKRNIQNICYEMKEGQRLEITVEALSQAFPCGWPTIYNNPREAFLSSMIGSAWGTWSIEHNFERHTYIISRHKPSEKRYYVDPDRRYLFKEVAEDGSLEPI